MDGISGLHRHGLVLPKESFLITLRKGTFEEAGYRLERQVLIGRIERKKKE